MGREDLPEPVGIGRHAEQRLMQIDHHIAAAVDRSVPRPVRGSRETPTLESEGLEGLLGDLEIGPADEEVAAPYGRSPRRNSIEQRMDL